MGGFFHIHLPSSSVFAQGNMVMNCHQIIFIIYQPHYKIDELSKQKSQMQRTENATALSKLENMKIWNVLGTRKDKFHPRL